MQFNLKTIWYFLGIMLTVFVVTFGILYFLDLTPETFKKEKISNVYELPENQEILPETFTKPNRIIISKVGIDAQIIQPNSINVTILDQALQKGAVYYPGSGTIEQGNIFVFGHSTNWAVVQNQAYKTFNGLEKLQIGDEIYLEAGGQNYLYKVQSVKMVNADNALVEFDNSGRKLTISTCNTFGQKQERWVVEAISVN